MKKIIERKNKGFTLIELIAVLAIIALLMVVFVPKVSGYIGEAKKVKALEQVRQVVLAVDTYNINTNNPIPKNETFSDIKNDILTYAKNNDLVDMSKIQSISDSITYTQMKEILQGDKEFTFNNKGEISSKPSNNNGKGNIKK